MKRWGVLLLVLIALCLASETALAYATPPDETWIAGFYDDDDGDDVAPLTGVMPRFVAVPLALPGKLRLVPTPVRPASLGRAPPAA
jgi:hypothetical protein